MSIIAELRDRTSHSGITLIHTGSEHVLVSNVFGVLKNLPQKIVLRELLKKIIGKEIDQKNFSKVKYHFWRKFPAPKGLKEGFTEVDTVIEFQDNVIFIESKYLSEESKGTTHEKDRNQLIRNLDIANIYSKKNQVKNFYVIYLTCEKDEPKIVQDIRNGNIISKLSLETKPEEINDKIYWASFKDISDILSGLALSRAFYPTELNFVRDLLDYLCKKGIAENRLCSFNNHLIEFDYYKICRKNCNGFREYDMFSTYRDESWRRGNWTKEELIRTLDNLSLKQKQLIYYLAKKGGGAYQYEIMADLDFLKEKNSRTLLGIKAGINRICKSLNKMPLLSIGIGSKDDRYHEINQDLYELRQEIIEYVVNKFNF